MSQFTVPNWKQRYQRQEQVEGEQGINRQSQLPNPGYVVPLSNYKVAELTWENGQLAMHGLGGIPSTAPQKATPTWVRTGDTLESIVHQATCHNPNLNLVQKGQNLANKSTVAASSNGKLGESSGHVQMDPSFVKKRMRSESDQCERNFSRSVQEESLERSAGASASANATFCIGNIDTTMMTRASFESPPSLKTKTTYGDSVCCGGSENQDEECKTKGEIVRSHSTRRSRSAHIHNQSERRRRDRINQKMKTLQKLVPNANKTDKASMLDEVIEYLKKLQAYVQMMSVRNMPQMMMPMGMQQHLQMSLLARMGMGVGLGMGMGMGMGVVPPSTPTFVAPPFVVPPMIPRHPSSQASPHPAATNTPVPLNDPYWAFLAQSMNIDLYNKMGALYRQQVNQATQATSSPSQSNNVKGE